MTTTGFGYSHVGPAGAMFAVTPSDATDLPVVAKALWVGGAGNISIIAENDTAPVTLNSAAAGTMITLRVKRVRATGTTATNIVAFI